MNWKRKRLEAMDDEDLYDVHLVGTDGEQVPCCKAILATVSPVFKSMFFRGFKEQKTDRCNLDFHSLVISLIVKYCYCGELDMDDLIFSKEKKSLSLQEETSVLVELREAGRYFEIEDLFSTAEAKIGSLVFQEENKKNTDKDDKRYQYASAFLSELFKRGEDKEPLGVAIFQFAVENTLDCFGPKSLQYNDSSVDTYYHVHPGVLSKVLDKNEDTYAVVSCLQTWTFLESESSAGKIRYGDEEKQALLRIAGKIDLKKLSTKLLSNVKPCSLFSSERIIEAFVHHCKCPEEEFVSSETPRRRTKPRLYVSGAGVESLNGFYEQQRLKRTGEMLGVFSKQVEHNGISCESVIHRKNGEKKCWLISIANNDFTVLSKKGHEVDERCIQMHVYESSFQPQPTEDAKAPPPFNSWKCCKGTNNPVPIVASIHKVSEGN